MEKVTEATLHLEKVTEAMAKCNLSLEYLKVTEAMAKCNLSLNYSQKIFWLDWTYVSCKYIGITEKIWRPRMLCSKTSKIRNA